MFCNDDWIFSRKQYCKSAAGNIPPPAPVSETRDTEAVSRWSPVTSLDGNYRTILFAGNRNKVFIESCQHKFVVIRGYPTPSTMDVIKSTGLKKKKKVTKQRAQEIRRRRSSIIQTAADMEVTHLDQLVVSELVAVAGDTRLLRVDEEDNEERREELTTYDKFCLKYI